LLISAQKYPKLCPNQEEETMVDLQKQVLEAMIKAGKPVKAGDVAELLGVAKDAVAKAIKNLKKDGKVDSPKVCFYAPVKK
jgi:Mn-dependent DtxR family transcriptional regulator